jgi:hypothetical protein
VSIKELLTFSMWFKAEASNKMILPYYMCKVKQKLKKQLLNK